MKLIKEHEINVPKGGWKKQTWYFVEMSMSSGNPVFEGLFFTGFVNNGQPAGYHTLFPKNTPEEKISYSQLHYLKVIREIEI